MLKPKMETQTDRNLQSDRITWFSMWFLGSVASFGAGFFPMYYRLVDSRNRHFRREAGWELRIAKFVEKQGKLPMQLSEPPHDRNAKAWAASIIVIIPVFLILYYLSRDLAEHERHQDKFLAEAFPQPMFMTQTIPIKKYVLITIATLGVGSVYWLYKIVNSYNAHFKAQWQLEIEISRLMEEKQVGRFM